MAAGCEYCRGEKPLTDKIYEDGSRFDDFQGTRIEQFGTRFMLVSYVNEKYFEHFKTLKPEQRKYMANNWGITINFCPMCNTKLEAKDWTQNKAARDAVLKTYQRQNREAEKGM